MVIDKNIKCCPYCCGEEYFIKQSFKGTCEYIVRFDGVIVAKRHMHITPEDALKYGVKDKDIIKVKISGDRSLIFDEVAVRVSDKFSTVIHIDYDEANACGFVKNIRGEILK